MLRWLLYTWLLENEMRFVVFAFIVVVGHIQWRNAKNTAPGLRLISSTFICIPTHMYMNVYTYTTTCCLGFFLSASLQQTSLNCYMFRSDVSCYTPFSFSN